MDGGFPIFEKWIYYEISEYSSDINFSNIHLCFAGAYVENREAYNLASDQMEFMLRVGYNSDMGAGIMLTNTYTLQRDNELKHGYNEIEGWYPLFKPTDKLTISRGVNKRQKHWFRRRRLSGC